MEKYKQYIDNPDYEFVPYSDKGSQGIEVEGGETAKGSFVFSKELGFARLHRPIAKAIGVIEQKPQTADRIGALRRLKQQEQELAQSQEHLKALNGIS